MEKYADNFYLYILEMALYKIGQHVNRIQDQEPKGAVVIAIQVDPIIGTCYELQYDEGGTGWWPETALTA